MLDKPVAVCKSNLKIPNVPTERENDLYYLLPTKRPDGTNFILLSSHQDAWLVEKNKNEWERSVGTPGEL